jgi:soluble lytic murein transglycosylase-like protein
MATIPSQSVTAGSEHAQRVLDPKAKARLQRAVKEFESVMVGYMLKSMRSSVPKDDMFGESYGGDMLEGMFDGELARYVSHGSALGLGEMLYKEITGEEMPRQNASGASKPGFAAPEVRVSVPPVTPLTPRAAVVPAAEAAVTRTNSPAPAAETSVARVTNAKTPDASGPVETIPVLRVRAVREQVPPSGVQVERPKEQPATSPAAVTVPPDTIRRRLEVLDPIIRTASDTTGVNAGLLKAVIAAESGGRTQAKSSRNAKGLMQLIDSTATAMGVRNVWDPLQNVQGGARYLGQMMDRFGGNIEHALASYNAGPGAVEKHKGVPPYRETQQYVGKVLEYLRYFEQQETGSDEQD